MMLPQKMIRASPLLLTALVERGADVDAQDNDGETALMNAARLGTLKAVAALLEGGADATILCNDGLTARDYALEEGRGADILDLLPAA